MFLAAQARAGDFLYISVEWIGLDVRVVVSMAGWLAGRENLLFPLLLLRLGASVRLAYRLPACPHPLPLAVSARARRLYLSDYSSTATAALVPPPLLLLVLTTACSIFKSQRAGPLFRRRCGSARPLLGVNFTHTSLLSLPRNLGSDACELHYTED